MVLNPRRSLGAIYLSFSEFSSDRNTAYGYNEASDSGGERPTNF